MLLLWQAPIDKQTDTQAHVHVQVCVRTLPFVGVAFRHSRHVRGWSVQDALPGATTSFHAQLDRMTVSGCAKSIAAVVLRSAVVLFVLVVLRIADEQMNGSMDACWGLACGAGS